MEVKDTRIMTICPNDNWSHKAKSNELQAPDAATTATSIFRILELPLEIRQLIYAHVLTKTRFIDGRVLERYITGNQQGLPPICGVSRQVRAEAFGAFLRSSTVNFSSYPRPNVGQIDRYIGTYDLRIQFWHNILSAHLKLCFPDKPYQASKNVRLLNLVQAAEGLRYLELTFSGWPYIPSGSALLNAIGGNEMLELLVQRPKLEEIKFIWTVNAPGWGSYKPNIDDIHLDRCKWDQALLQLESGFLHQGIRVKVKPWMESADRRLWEHLLAANTVR